MIIIEIKCTIHAMPLNHPETIPLVRGKTVFCGTSPWCQKVWDCWIKSCYQAASSGLRQKIRLAGSSPGQDHILPAHPSTEQLLQSKRKGGAEAPRKMLDGSPTQPPDAQCWSPADPGPEMGTVLQGEI